MNILFNRHFFLFMALLMTSVFCEKAPAVPVTADNSAAIETSVQENEVTEDMKNKSMLPMLIIFIITTIVVSFLTLRHGKKKSGGKK